MGIWGGAAWEEGHGYVPTRIVFSLSENNQPNRAFLHMHEVSCILQMRKQFYFNFGSHTTSAQKSLSTSLLRNGLRLVPGYPLSCSEGLKAGVLGNFVHNSIQTVPVVRMKKLNQDLSHESRTKQMCGVFFFCCKFFFQMAISLSFLLSLQVSVSWDIGEWGEAMHLDSKGK